MPSVATYWHTLRHLRLTQFYGQIRLRLVRPRVDSRPAPLLRLKCGTWAKPAQRGASLVGPDRFRFLNETRDLADHGWDCLDLEKLWRYNLHYFDDLNAQDAIVRAEWHRDLLLRWVRENPPAAGTGWEPFPTSLRIVNWIKWALTGSVLPPTCAQSLAVQARWLSRRFEIHLLANHLFANAKALVFAGLFFEGTEADAWLEKGLSTLTREVREQILPDGGQFERSTMYHALALEDMLDLFNVITTFGSAVPSRFQSVITDWWERIGAMRDWLVAMCHPDGEISFFNDAAVGIAPAPIEIENYAKRLGFSDRPALATGLTRLVDSGYLRIEENRAVALLDVGPIGPEYMPGHAHADTLSFELSLFGHRAFVNTGTSRYGLSAERLRQRGTAAHNTVVVDGQNSSQVWAGFRVAKRARPMGLEIACNGNIVVRCSHDGYRHLLGKREHQRQWLFTENALEIEDRILGNFKHAEVRFHLHPAVLLNEMRLSSSRDAKVVLNLPQGQQVQFSIHGGALRKETTIWHPEFGRDEANLCLIVTFIGPVVRTCLNWAGAI